MYEHLLRREQLTTLSVPQTQLKEITNGTGPIDMQQRKGCVEYGEEGEQYACASLSSGSCVESDKADGRENYRE